MLYFREKEKQLLWAFAASDTARAMAIYGRRRIGKTELALEYVRSSGSRCVYFQCASFDYEVCLSDFKAAAAPGDSILASLKSFKDAFTYLTKQETAPAVYIIDEFPYLAKKRPEAAAEFQWIIDHGLNGKKLILLGSNMSFMKQQLCECESPLYGRFDSALELLPFTFTEVRTLFPGLEDAVQVYGMTGGVPQYVMQFLRFPTVEEAAESLFFDKDGRLFQEAGNLLMQELRDVSTYVSILRAIGSGEKESGQIASKCAMDARGVFAYLAKLTELGILHAVENSFSGGKREKRYRIADCLFRFTYTFIDPHISMISALGAAARPYILNEAFREYLGFVYEDIIRSSCYALALQGVLPFMPETVGKWWGPALQNGTWQTTEVDLIACNGTDVLIGECKYKNKAVGLSELEQLKQKAACIPVKNRRIHYLLASRSGFTAELLSAAGETVLLEGVTPVSR